MRGRNRYLVAGLLCLAALSPSRVWAAASGRHGGIIRRPSAVETQSLVPQYSQYLHQAPAGRFELTPGLALDYSSLSRPTASRETRFGHPLGVSAEYGFSRLFSLAFHLLWDSSADSRCAADGTCISTTTSGFFDPNADLKFHSQVGAGTLAYGANVSYAVEKYKVQDSGDDNNATGGSAITAFIAYELPLGRGLGGVKFTDDLYKGDRQAEQSGTSYTVSGGAAYSLTGFYEVPQGKTILGGALTILSAKSRTGYRADTGQTVNWDDAYMQFLLKGYALVSFSPRLQLLPQVSLAYDKFDNGSTYWQIQTGADLRLSF